MFDETKVQIGNDVLLDVGINPDWYISSVGYECGCEEKAREVTITLRNKGDENKLRRTLGELIAESKDEPQTDGYMTAEQTVDYRKMLDNAEHKVYGNVFADEPQSIIGGSFPSYITEDRTTQVLDGWQVNPRTSTTAIEDEPQTCFNCKHNVVKHTFDHACDGCANMNRYEREDEQTEREGE